MNHETVLVTFDNVSFKEKQHLIQNLNNCLRKTANIEGELLRENSNTQDAGTILSIVLSAPAIVAVANGIFNWLQKNREVEISFTKDDSRFQIKNISSKEVKTVIKGLQDLMTTNEF